MRAPARWAPRADHAFRHEALLYAGNDAFVGETAPFILEGLAAGEPTLVVVTAPKADLLRSHLAGDADEVFFADMEEVGANPARIISAWDGFVNEHGQRGPVRGIGEPVWPERSKAELAECRQHEFLLNLAFADTPAFWLVCPYDTEALSPGVIADARSTHPFIAGTDGAVVNAGYRGASDVAAAFDAPLPAPPEGASGLHFGPRQLRLLRSFVADQAAAAGLGGERAADLLLAVNEVATNTLMYGGGYGLIRIWQDDGTLVCQLQDNGRLTKPLAGRRRPPLDAGGGRGLWLVNQVSDLTQVRSSTDGTVVRLHLRVA